MPPLRPLRIALVALACALGAAGPAAAATIDGSPLNVFVGTTGRLSAQFDGSPTNLFFPAASPDGDAGLTLAFTDQSPSAPGFSVGFGGFTPVGQTQQGTARRPTRSSWTRSTRPTGPAARSRS